MEPEIIFQDEHTTVINGDIIDCLKDDKLVPFGSIQLAMTSVPYWRQRLYSEGSWGFEGDWNEWIDKMVNLGRWLRFSLRESGSVFLNIGDKYGGSNPTSDYGDKRFNVAPGNFSGRSAKRRAVNDIVNRKNNLMMLPERVTIEWTDELKYDLMNKVIWHKPDPTPQSVNDKFVPTYEPIYFFAKNGEKHTFYRERIGVEKRDRRTTPKAIVQAERERVVGKQGSIFGVDEVEFDPSRAPKDQNSAEYAYWYENIREKQAWHDHKNDAVEGQRFTKGQALSHPSGSNPGDVWSIQVGHDDYFKDESVRRAGTWPSWPIELCLLPILACTDVGDTVLDPFGGSGSLGVAAKELGRKSIMVDIDRESCLIMADRITRTKAGI